MIFATHSMRSSMGTRSSAATHSAPSMSSGGRPEAHQQVAGALLGALIERVSGSSFFTAHVESVVSQRVVAHDSHCVRRGCLRSCCNRFPLAQYRLQRDPDRVLVAAAAQIGGGDMMIVEHDHEPKRRPSMAGGERDTALVACLHDRRSSLRLRASAATPPGSRSSGPRLRRRFVQAGQRVDSDQP